MKLLDREAMIPPKALDLVNGYRMHASIGGCGAKAQVDGQKSAGFHESRNFSEGSFAMGWRHVLPDGIQQDKIEIDPQATEAAQLWKVVIDPADTGVGMKAPPLRTHAA